MTSRALVMSLLVGVAACGAPEDDAATPTASVAPLSVYATSYPLAFFAERIGGDAVTVAFAVPAGVDPAHWNPTPDEVAEAQRAELLLRHGAGDARWIEAASLDRRRVVDTTAVARERLLQQPGARHQHGPDGAHTHGELAGTTWLDLGLAVTQAEAIAAAFAARRPAAAERFAANLETLREALHILDREWAEAAASLADTPVLFSHPVYAYFEARYGVRGASLVWEPDAMPEEGEWRALAERLAREPAVLMFWEAAPLPEVARRLAELGVASRVLAPAAGRPAAEQGDWLEQMRANTGALRPVGDTAEAP